MRMMNENENKNENENENENKNDNDNKNKNDQFSIFNLLTKLSIINFNIAVIYFYSWKKVFFVKINRNLIITFCIIISKNK